MKQVDFSRSFCIVLFALLVVGALLGCATTQTPSATTSPSSSPATALSAKEATPSSLASVPCCMAPYYPPPDRIDLCGEPAPLEVQDVQERFDRALRTAVPQRPAAGRSAPRTALRRAFRLFLLPRDFLDSAPPAVQAGAVVFLLFLAASLVLGVVHSLLLRRSRRPLVTLNVDEEPL